MKHSVSILSARSAAWPGRKAQQDDASCDSSLVFLEETKVKTRFGCCSGILPLGKNSRFDCTTRHKLGNVAVEGGDVVLRDGKRYVEIRQSLMRISMAKQPGTIYPLALQARIPASATDGQQYMLGVSQLNTQGVVAGGAGVVYVVS